MAVFTDGLVVRAVGVNRIWLVSDAVPPGPLTGARLTVTARA
jgi:hypothetical protein